MWMGGVSEFAKVAALASTRGVSLVPHGSGPFGYFMWYVSPARRPEPPSRPPPMTRPRLSWRAPDTPPESPLSRVDEIARQAIQNSPDTHLACTRAVDLTAWDAFDPSVCGSMAFANVPMAEFLVMSEDADECVPNFGTMFVEEPLPINGYISLPAEPRASLGLLRA